MINATPLISVGIPTYNRPEGLERTLQQITSQTYKNLEIREVINNFNDHLRHYQAFVQKYRQLLVWGGEQKVQHL